MALRTRQPTGQMTHPVILLEGETGSGRSWAAALLSASPKVHRTFWLQLGEVTADEYARIPTPSGAPVRYEIIKHDNSWVQIYDSVREAKAEALRDREHDPRPDVLVIDTVGWIWDYLSEWAENRARSSKKNQEALAADPNAAIDIGPTYWNPATKRWRQLMTQLLTFPGIVILLSRGRETAHIGPYGNPVPGKADYKVAGQASLVSDVRVWLRMTQELGPDKAKLIKQRTVEGQVMPPAKGSDIQVIRGHGEILKKFSLESLIFDRLRYDPTNVLHNALQPMQAGSDAPLTEAALPFETGIETAETIDQLREVWANVTAAHSEQRITDDDRRSLLALREARRLNMEHDAEKARLIAKLAAEQARLAAQKPREVPADPAPDQDRPEGLDADSDSAAEAEALAFEGQGVNAMSGSPA